MSRVLQAPANSDGIALFANRRPDWQLPDLNVELVLSQDLQPAQLSQRSSCPKCNRSRSMFCYDCLEPLVACPRLRLPVKFSIITHTGEQASKNTGVHAAIIAPEDVTLHDLDHCPSFDPAMAVVLFPSDDALEVQALQPRSLQRVFIIDSKWKKAKELNQHPALRGVRRVRLTHHRSSFWRFHTSGVADDGGKIGSTATPGPEQDVHKGRSGSTPFLAPEALPQPAPTSTASQPQPDAGRGPQAAPQAQPQLTPQPAPQPALQPAPAGQHQPEVEGVVQPASQPATQAQPQAQPQAQSLAPPSPDLHAFDDLMWFFAQQHRHIQQQAVLKLQQRKDRKRKVSRQGLRGASGSGQQDQGQGQGQAVKVVIGERRHVIRAALRGLVEAARPDLSPAEVDAVVAEVNKRMTMGSKQCVLAAVLCLAVLLKSFLAPAQLPPQVQLGIWDPQLLVQIMDGMELLTKASPSEVAVFEKPSSAWLIAMLKELDEEHLRGDLNTLNANATTIITSIQEFYRHPGRFIRLWCKAVGVDAVWEVYLDPKWARQRLRLYGAQDRALEQFFKTLDEDMAEVSMERHGHAKPRGAGQRRGRVVLVDEHRTTRVSSAVNGQQPCEEELDHEQPTRRAGWKPPAGQVDLRLLRPAWSQQRGQPVRGLMWCPVVPPRKPPQAPRSSQAATQPAASEPGPSTPPPAKRSKRTKAEQAAEPTQPTKAAKAKPAPQPVKGLDWDCNAALNLQRIGESRWRPLELCYWPDQTALPAKGKEYPGLGYKRLRDKPPKAQQQQQQQQHQSITINSSLWHSRVNQFVLHNSHPQVCGTRVNWTSYLPQCLAIPAPRSSHAHTENPVAGQLCIFSSSSSLRSLDLGDALPHDAGSGCSGTLFPQQGRSPDYVVNNVRGPVLRRASRSAMLDHSPTAADASLPRRGVSRKCSFMLPNPTPRQSGGCSGRVSDNALTTEIAATALADSAAMCDSGGSSFRRKSVEQSAPTFPLRSARNRCSTEIDLVIARSGNSSCSGSLPPITNMPASSSPLLHRLACLHSTSFTAGKTASLSGAAAPSHDDRQQQQQQQHLSHLCPTAAPECHSGSGLARRAIPLRTRSFSRVPSMLQQDAVCHQTIPSSGSTHTLNMGTALVAWLQKPSLHQCSLGSEEGQEAVLPEEQGVAAGGQDPARSRLHNSATSEPWSSHDRSMAGHIRSLSSASSQRILQVGDELPPDAESGGVPDTTALAPAPADLAALCDSGGQPFRRRSIELPRPASALRSARGSGRRGSVESQLMTPKSGSISNGSYSGSLPPIASLQAHSTPTLNRLASLRSTSFTAAKTACLSGTASPSHDNWQQHQLSQPLPTALPESDPVAGPARHAAALRTKSFGRLPSMRLQEATSPQALPYGSSKSGSLHPLNMGTALVAWLMKPVPPRSAPSSSGVGEAAQALGQGTMADSWSQYK
ncbi:hypothetical protein QJQ45_002068 [Haematococcus lacustris]|nr:hypothetical protein QJQ45_002068 [Haematococcus lacustris]